MQVLAPLAVAIGGVLAFYQTIIIPLILRSYQLTPLTHSLTATTPPPLVIPYIPPK